MRFLYEYRTPDNERHPGVICAADREAAYAELRRKGIKPCRFAEAPGFFNKLFGKGKRWLAIGVLGVLCLVFAVAFFAATSANDPGILHTLEDTTRRQVVGDAAVIEKGIRTGWADIFALEGERFLASYAIPGASPAVRSATEGEINEVLGSSAPSRKSNSLEERQIRAMVSGMKDELRAYIADGGTFAKYMRRLMRRQMEEVGYYERARRELERAAQSSKSIAELEVLWEKRNAQLRKMGIKLVPMPDKEK